MLFSLHARCMAVSAVIATTLPILAHSLEAEARNSKAEKARPPATVNQLDEITVHGQIEQTPSHAGASTLTYHELEKRNIDDWTDFSKRGESGVNFNRQNKSVNVRGMDADRVVTRIDGVPLPWLNDGARGVQGGLSALSFDSLESITFKGNADTVRSGAVTGALDLTTLSPGQLLRHGKSFGALLRSSYDSADYGRNINAALAGRLSSDTRWLLQAGVRHGDELRNYGGKGGYGPDRIRINPLSFKENSVMFKLEHDLSANHRLEASGERFYHSAEIENLRDQGPGTGFALDGNTSKETIERERLLFGYQYQSDDAVAAIDTGYIKTWWQRMELEARQNALRTPDERGYIIPGDPFRYQFPFGKYVRDNSTSETSYGLTTQWSGFLQQATVLHNWSVGGDWYHTNTKQASRGYDNCPAIPAGLPAPFGPRSCDLLHTGQSDIPRVSGNSLALWVQDDILWGDDRYALTPGLRFDSYRHRPKTGADYTSNPNANLANLSSNSGKHFSPSLRATFTPSDKLSIYASYAYGFKAPSPSQLYLNYGAPGTYLRVGNPDLLPETSRGLELGIQAGSSDLNGLLRVFHNRYDNFIDTDYGVTPGDPDWNPVWNGQYPMGVTMAVNRARVRTYGAEASGHWQISPRWYARAAIAWTRGKDLTTNQPLNTIAPLKTRLVAGYEQATWGAETQLTMVARRSRVANEAKDFQAPGYGITDFAVWWTPSAAKGLKLQAGVYNLFDKKYWDALHVPNSGRNLAPIDYYSEPGRSFRLALTYSY